MPARFRPLLLLALTAFAACGSAQAASKPDTPASTLGGVGVLPGAVAAAQVRTTAAPATAAPSTAAGTSTTTSATTTTIAASTSTAAPIAALKATTPAGERAAGNRVLMIGDSVMAGTSSRYSNDMCKAVVPLGWRVEVDAEVGRFIDFADRVLDSRLSAGWDAAVIFLGSNYGDNQPIFASLLEDAVDRLSPRPVVLVTVTEFKPTRAEVNAAVKLIAFNHPNVSVVDWATISESPGVLSGDDLHPTPAGRQALAQAVADALGTAPAQPGACQKSSFRDDSAGSVDTGTTAPVNPQTTRRATATTKPTTQTTAKPGSVTTTTKPTGTTTGTTTKPTTAPTTADTPTTAKSTTTDAPTTAKATTDPPRTTAAQTTSPPATTAGP